MLDTEALLGRGETKAECFVSLNALRGRALPVFV